MLYICTQPATSVASRTNAPVSTCKRWRWTKWTHQKRDFNSRSSGKCLRTYRNCWWLCGTASCRDVKQEGIAREGGEGMCLSSLQMSQEFRWQREGGLFTFSNIYFCIRYQVHKCKYSESIIKSIRNYRECNTNCNKLNKLELSSCHTCKSACQSLMTKVLGFVFLFFFLELYKTDYHKYRLLFILSVLENTKTSVYNSI